MTRMPEPEKDRPVILVVDGEQDDLARISDELKTRYGGHYDGMCMSSTSEGKDALDNLTNTGRNVALVLADRGAPPIGQHQGDIATGVGQVVESVLALACGRHAHDVVVAPVTSLQLVGDTGQVILIAVHD